MLLQDLDGHFLKYISANEYQIVDSLAEADGVQFQCPKCAQGLEIVLKDRRRFVKGAHYVICWFVGHVPDNISPSPGRWNPKGTCLDDLTFIGPGAYSVLLTGPGCGWHGYIINGTAT